MRMWGKKYLFHARRDDDLWTRSDDSDEWVLRLDIALPAGMVGDEAREYLTKLTAEAVNKAMGSPPPS